MRKKILVLLCTGIFALSLAGCEDKKDDKKETRRRKLPLRILNCQLKMVSRKRKSL